jgi:hypothetical protein
MLSKIIPCLEVTYVTTVQVDLSSLSIASRNLAELNKHE